MKNVGYKLISSKTSETDQVALWQPLNKAYPKVATALSWKCSTSADDKDLTTLVIYQVGEARHLAFYEEDYKRMAGVAQEQANTPQVTLKSPTGPAKPNRNGMILVELYNPNKIAVDVKLKVTVRDASGKPVNVYVDRTTFHVEPNSPFQQSIEILGADPFDAVITVVP